MSLSDIIARRITGIRPFDEMPVDAQKWREAHNQHHLHRLLHAAAAHRPGVVYGLEVLACKNRERAIVVAPGVGIDSLGRTILLPEPVYFELVEARQIYVTLSFLPAVDRESAIALGSGQEYFREIEGFELNPTRELPDKPHLELARIFRSNADKPIKDAANPFDPGNDEINLLYRPVAFPHCYADDGVGELPYLPKTSASSWKPNRAGLWNLLREGNGRGFHLQFTGQIRLREETETPPALLYMAGKQGFQALTEEELGGLQRFLAAGGLLMGESCEGSAEFEASFRELGERLGAKLKAVEKGDPLLTAHYVFGAPPPGAHSSGVLQMDAAAGILFSARNYGGAWQGELEKADAADARERIRQAQEFGLNIVAYAAKRRRALELGRLG